MKIRHWLWLGGGIILLLFIIFLLFLLFLLPPRDNVPINYPPTYFVPQKSHFEAQGRNQCAGFAAAYILRTKKIEITGEAAYHQIPYKLSNGYVRPHGIPLYFKTHNLKLKMVKGSLPSLKTRLTQGTPIILLVKAGNGLHYITLLGYDNKNLYLFDSLRSSKSTKSYNRVLTNAELNSLWQVEIPFFKQVYLFIQ